MNISKLLCYIFILPNRLGVFNLILNNMRHMQRSVKDLPLLFKQLLANYVYTEI